MGINSPPASSPLVLVVDANILVGRCLSPRGQTFLRDTTFQMFVTEYTFAECLRHIQRRVQERTRAEGFTPEQEMGLLFLATSVATDTTRRISLADYEEYEQEARRRIPNDPDDWHTAALALAYGAAVWTEDKHFWGCGIAVWSTARLLSHLTAQ